MHLPQVFSPVHVGAEESGKHTCISGCLLWSLLMDLLFSAAGISLMLYLIWSISQPLWLFSICFAGFFWIFYNQVFTSASGAHRELYQWGSFSGCQFIKQCWALKTKSRPCFLCSNPPRGVPSHSLEIQWSDQGTQRLAFSGLWLSLRYHLLNSLTGLTPLLPCWSPCCFYWISVAA